MTVSPSRTPDYQRGASAAAHGGDVASGAARGPLLAVLIITPSRLLLNYGLCRRTPKSYRMMKVRQKRCQGPDIYIKACVIPVTAGCCIDCRLNAMCPPSPLCPCRNEHIRAGPLQQRQYPDGRGAAFRPLRAEAGACMSSRTPLDCCL